MPIPADDDPMMVEGWHALLAAREHDRTQPKENQMAALTDQEPVVHFSFQTLGDVPEAECTGMRSPDTTDKPADVTCPACHEKFPELTGRPSRHAARTEQEENTNG